jgi:hypothetical protein
MSHYCAFVIFENDVSYCLLGKSNQEACERLTEILNTNIDGIHTCRGANGKHVTCSSVEHLKEIIRTDKDFSTDNDIEKQMAEWPKDFDGEHYEDLLDALFCTDLSPFSYGSGELDNEMIDFLNNNFGLDLRRIQECSDSDE